MRPPGFRVHRARLRMARSAAEGTCSRSGRTEKRRGLCWRPNGACDRYATETAGAESGPDDSPSGIEWQNPDAVTAPIQAPLSRSPSQTPSSARIDRFQRKGAKARRRKKTKESEQHSSWSPFCASAPLRLCVEIRISARIRVWLPASGASGRCSFCDLERGGRFRLTWRR
jgi:hypothetical protein